jgi:hypothetical protein
MAESIVLMRELLTVLPALLLAATLGAQGPPRTQLFLGPSICALRTSHPEGGPIGIGGALGVARQFSERASLRATLGVTRNVITMDDISVCRRQPDGSCLPDAIVHRWVSTVELQGALVPLPKMPLGIVLGAGLARSDDAGANRRNAPVVSEARARGLWRAGLELRLGRSAHSPRLQVSRSGFSAALYSTKFVDALVLSLFP